MAKRMLDLVTFRGSYHESMEREGKKVIKSILDIVDGLFPQGNARTLVRKKVLDEVNELVRFAKGLIDDEE